MKSLDDLYKEINNFCSQNHGSSDYYKEKVYVIGHQASFSPLSYLVKKINWISNQDDLIKQGFITDTYDFLKNKNFQDWYKKTYTRNLIKTNLNKINFIYLPNNKEIFTSIERVFQNYEILRSNAIIQNNKNLPTQLGEWFAKCIFGLLQKKTSSQKGFDFFYKDQKVEVIVEWGKYSSPKGVKLKKSAINLTTFCIIIYLDTDFRIRDLSFFESSFVLRKFNTKGHAIFLKDQDISSYLLSSSTHFLDKIVNSTSLLKYSTPKFAMQISEYFELTN